MFNNRELYRLRVISCLSQGELARETGINQQSISMWELGKQQPRGESVKVLADYFKIKPKQLFIKGEK